MNTRENYKAILSLQNYDEMPLVHFGFWWELVVDWKNKGYIDSTNYGDIGQKLGFDFHFKSDSNSNLGPFKMGLFPQFESEVIKELPDGSQHVRNRDGVTELFMPGLVSIPSEIEHLLVDRASYEEHYKPRLQWCEKRLPTNLAQLIELGNAKTEEPNMLYAGSTIGSIRNWLGIVGLSYMQIDDPELLKEIIDTASNLALKVAKCWLDAGLRPDIAHYFEDICFNHGPLISPDFFATHLSEHYRNMCKLLKSYNCDLISVDSDGKIDELLPLWLDSGVNVLFPLEIGTWHPDYAEMKKQYGDRLRVVGGMDKKVLAQDKAAVDREIERLKRWIGLGGFVPCPDHLLAPDTKWDLVRYYTDRARVEFNK